MKLSVVAAVVFLDPSFLDLFHFSSVVPWRVAPVVDLNDRFGVIVVVVRKIAVRR